MVDRILCSGVVAFRGDDVLLIKHSEEAGMPTGSHGLPAGSMKDGEMSHVTAIRELGEEGGLRTSSVYLRKLSVRKNTLELRGEPKDFEFHPYLCVKYRGQIKESPEGVPEWVDRNHLGELNLVGDVEDIVEEAYLALCSGEGSP